MAEMNWVESHLPDLRTHRMFKRMFHHKSAPCRPFPVFSLQASRTFVNLPGPSNQLANPSSENSMFRKNNDKNQSTLDGKKSS